jgi:UPF0176 protein
LPIFVLRDDTRILFIIFISLFVMDRLYNRISNKELKLHMLQDDEPRVTISFYKYFHVDDPQQFRDDLYVKFNAIKVFGRVYIASEGINGQISVPDGKKGLFKDILYGAHPLLEGIRLNSAVEDNGRSFWVLRMKVRKKIVVTVSMIRCSIPPEPGNTLPPVNITN